MMTQDRNFDDLAERFARNIYGSAKGEIRLAVVWNHLTTLLPRLQQGPPLRILDAGCGFAQLGLRLAQLGHEVVLSDLSQNMLAGAKEQAQATGVGENVQFVQAPVQALSAAELGQFDLILFHAVLEWLAQPRATLHQLLGLLKPQGHLSLMFYNRDALVFHNLKRGNWRKVASGELQGEAGGLTPYHPLTLGEVESWLDEWQMALLGRAGVRVIYDYMPRAMRDSRPLAEMVQLELQYAEREPYLRMGRYLHLLAQKKGGE